MKERPIPFSTPMVRAILDGRKSQTRRVAKANHSIAELVHKKPVLGRHWCEPGGWIRCPYGQPEDLLWVRETWRTVELSDGTDGYWYAAGGFSQIPNTKKAAENWVESHAGGKHGSKWRQSTHMPRWASRITLDIVSVGVDQLQDISEEDAWAEGFYSVESFRQDWDKTNPKRPWESNPWVWVLEFKLL